MPLTSDVLFRKPSANYVKCPFLLCFPFPLWLGLETALLWTHPYILSDAARRQPQLQPGLPGCLYVGHFFRFWPNVKAASRMK
jgi:hypothetical protein